MPRGPAQGEAARGPVAGPRFHILSGVTVAFVILYLAVIVALVVADIYSTNAASLRHVFGSPEIRAAMLLSLLTSGASLLLILVFAVPVGYALSRYQFPGHVLVDTLVDLPIVLPPVVVGFSLLVFFSTPVGRWIEGLGVQFTYHVGGIILCQFIVSASFGIRAVAAAFDAADPRLEQLALTLGCTPFQAFWRVALPMARNGIAAGGIVAWAHAVGIFGPLMVFVGSVRRKTEVMPTSIYLELTVGRLEIALAIALVMLAMASIALIVIHSLAPGRRWWGR